MTTNPSCLVVVVPCSAAKLSTTAPVPAADLSVGSFHRLCRRAAHAIAGGTGTVLVLSAAHGFVTLDEPLAPYELRMGEPGSVQPDQLRAQAERLGLHHARQLIALGGRAYVDAVATVRPDVLRPWPAAAASASSATGCPALPPPSNRCSWHKSSRTLEFACPPIRRPLSC